MLLKIIIENTFFNLDDTVTCFPIHLFTHGLIIENLLDLGYIDQKDPQFLASLVCHLVSKYLENVDKRAVVRMAHGAMAIPMRGTKLGRGVRECSGDSFLGKQELNDDSLVK